MKKETIFFLVGPTAVGKSLIAAKIARRIKAEIISCDSMQVYKGMPILTSMPAAALRKSIPHHLVAMLSPQKEFDVFAFRKAAVKTIGEIIKRGKAPIVVGGTGLYMSVLVDGIFEGVSGSERVRRNLYKEMEKHGKEALYRRLAHVDPEAAARIHPHDARRIIRALEVFEVSGKPISVLQKQRKGLADEFNVRIACLTMALPALYRRIEERTEEMFKKGLVKEVKKISARKLSKTASRAIGIQEVRGYLKGEYDLSEARRRVSYNTRQYARRQLTWFRKDKRIAWITISDRSSAAQAADKVLRKWKKRF